MNTRIISFHGPSTKPEVTFWQKEVFNHLNIPLEQIQTNLPHAYSIDRFLNYEEWNNVVIFDSDCIPLYKSTIKLGLNVISHDGWKTLYGNAQKSSHIPTSKIFVAPSFLIMNRKLWELTNKFPMLPVDGKGDVAELFSREVENVDGELCLLFPTNCEKELWTLTKNIMFGWGTTFDDDTYHAFEVNNTEENTNRFVTKCKWVIENNK